MPITLFHFGPGALLHAAAPRHVSFLSFCAANVLIDFESLYNLVHQRHPVHAFFHTYVGATLVVAAVVLLFLGLRAFASRYRIPNLLRWRDLTLTQVAVGAALGAYSHIVLDSVMHGDIQPGAPFVTGNALLAVIPLGTLHWVCVGLGLAGCAVLLMRRWVGRVRRQSVTSGPPS
ncbi:MAG: hypothetical protein K0R58_3325 [Ramlibacter sp.]|jgi:hypothetical protein|nr:hypothetical protein [Ramlibacter sp.]